MKKLLLLLLCTFLIFSCWEKKGDNKKIPNDLTKENIKGNVKEIIITEFYSFYEDGYVSERTQYNQDGYITKLIEYLGLGPGITSIDSYQEYQYNEDGHITDLIQYNADGVINWSEKYQYDEYGNKTEEVSDRYGVYSTKYQYNEDGHITDLIQYNADGVIDSYQEYQYNEDGHITDLIQYNTDGEINRECKYQFDEYGNMTQLCSEYLLIGDFESHIMGQKHDPTFEILSSKIQYNKDGNMTEYIQYNTDGELERKIEYQYDEYGNKTEETSHNADGELERKIEYQYEYDNLKNWIVERKYTWYLSDSLGDKLENIIEREIEYYE